MTKIFVESLGFRCLVADHSIFYCQEGDEHTVIAVATDDMAVTSKRKADIEKFKMEVKKHWDITDNGPINRFLGLKIKWNRKNKTLAINQCVYIISLMEKFRLTNAKPINTPMEPNVAYSNQQLPSTSNQVARMQGVPYSKGIGSVLWLLHL